MGHIKEIDGFRGLYRGVIPRVLAGTFGNMVQINVSGVSFIRFFFFFFFYKFSVYFLPFFKIVFFRKKLK